MHKLKMAYFIFLCVSEMIKDAIGVYCVWQIWWYAMRERFDGALFYLVAAIFLFFFNFSSIEKVFGK